MTETSAERWIALLALILSVAIIGGGIFLFSIGHDLPSLPAFQGPPASEESWDLLSEIPDRSGFLADVKPMRGDENPFFTTFFEPPPTPAPPPRPTTQDVKVLYQGRYISSQGEVQAFVSVEGKLSIVTIESVLPPHFTLKSVSPERIELLTTDDQTLEVPFNKETTLKVPIP